jgi:hypothetical protein
MIYRINRIERRLTAKKIFIPPAQSAEPVYPGLNFEEQPAQ